MFLARAVRELVALILIWVGTGAITFFGIPELVPSHAIALPGGKVLTIPPGKVIVTADIKGAELRDAYYRWAGGGMVFITAGMMLQAITPAHAIIQSRRRRRTGQDRRA